MTNAICAVIAGAVSSAIANPTDVIKVRMQVAGTTGTQNIGLINCFKDVYTQEGISGLWRVIFKNFMKKIKNEIYVGDFGLC